MLTGAFALKCNTFTRHFIQVSHVLNLEYSIFLDLSLILLHKLPGVIFVSSLTSMCKASSGCSPIRPSVIMTRFPASLDVCEDREEDEWRIEPCRFRGLQDRHRVEENRTRLFLFTCKTSEMHRHVNGEASNIVEAADGQLKRSVYTKSLLNLEW